MVTKMIVHDILRETSVMRRLLLRKEATCMATVNEKLESFGLKRVLNYLDSNPQENVPKVVGWLRKLDRDNYYKNAYDMVDGFMKDPDNNWNRLISSVYADIDDGVRRKMFENFLINSAILGSRRKNKCVEKYDCNIPWAILMDLRLQSPLHGLLGGGIREPAES